MNIEERIARLERQNWRLRIGLGLLVLLMAATLTIGARKTTPFGETVEAQEFLLKDKNGKARASLASIGGLTQLELFDSRGNARLALAVTEKGGPGLWFYGQDWKTRAILGVTKDGKAALEIYDTTEKLRAELTVSENGSPDLGLYGKDNQKAIGPRTPKPRKPSSQ